VILPLVKSYGLSSIRTLSPTKIFTKFFLILPLIVERMRGWVSGAPSILQRNMALGRLSTTIASTSMTSSLTFLTRSLLFFRSFPLARASFFPKSDVGEEVRIPWEWCVTKARGVTVIEGCWILTLLLLHDVMEGAVKAVMLLQKMMDRHRIKKAFIFLVER